MSLTVKNQNVELPENPYKSTGTYQGISAQMVSSVLASTEGLSILGMSAGGSAGFSVIRFTQVLKVYNRLKYIGVFFGESMENFLTSLGELFPDSETDITRINDQRIQEKGSIGKISYFRVYSDLYQAIGFKLYIYMGLSLISLLAESLVLNCLKKPHSQRLS